MPRLPQVRTDALKDLEAQLRFAPVEALRRDIVRAEALAADIEPAQAYPMSWVIFRITGYRPDGADVVITGASLLEDLSALVERMCVAAEILIDELDAESFLSIEDLESRWSVSRSTINRHRKRGLVARRVRDRAGKDRLLFSVESVRHHEQRHADDLGRAGSYTRIDETTRAAILTAAATLGAQGLSLNEAAQRIASDVARSHEAVRQVLRKHDAGAATPLFEDPGRLSDRERRVIARAAARAIEPAQIAKRLDRSDEAVRRAIDGARADVLHRIDRSGALEAPERIAAKVDDEAWMAETLGADQVVAGLCEPIPTDLLALIAWAKAQPRRRAPQARLTAHQALRARAARAIRSLTTSAPSASVIDRAETDIRWSVLLKTQIVRAHLPGVIATVEETLGAPLDRLRPREARDAVRDAIAAAGVVIDMQDPRAAMAAPLALGVSSALTRRSAGATGRASARLGEGVDLAPLLDVIAPRLAPLMAPATLAPGLEALGADDRALLEERYGYTIAPSTLAEIAQRRGVQPMHIARRLRRAWRDAMSAARVLERA